MYLDACTHVHTSMVIEFGNAMPLAKVYSNKVGIISVALDF